MTVLFWDIDGTLLTTAKAGVFAWNDSVKEVTGQDFDLRSAIRIGGYTDYQIAVKTFEFLGLEAAEGQVERLVRRYEELLPSSLPRKQGRVLENVREILEHLRARRPDVRSYLLTGNTPGGARAKLTHYGLAEFFDGATQGAFSTDTSSRGEIAGRAVELARRSGPVAAERLFVIGDTPHDIECARAIGARTIAVASGDYAAHELATHGPWQLLEALPPPDAFLRLIDEAAGASPAAAREGAAG